MTKYANTLPVIEIKSRADRQFSTGCRRGIFVLDFAVLHVSESEVKDPRSVLREKEQELESGPQRNSGAVEGDSTSCR